MQRERRNLPESHNTLGIDYKTQRKKYKRYNLTYNTYYIRKHNFNSTSQSPSIKPLSPLSPILTRGTTLIELDDGKIFRKGPCLIHGKNNGFLMFPVGFPSHQSIDISASPAAKLKDDFAKNQALGHQFLGMMEGLWRCEVEVSMASFCRGAQIDGQIFFETMLLVEAWKLKGPVRYPMSQWKPWLCLEPAQSMMTTHSAPK